MLESSISCWSDLIDEFERLFSTGLRMPHAHVFPVSSCKFTGDAFWRVALSSQLVPMACAGQMLPFSLYRRCSQLTPAFLLSMEPNILLQNGVRVGKVAPES